MVLIDIDHSTIMAISALPKGRVAAGKSCKIEQIEMNTVLVNDKTYYNLIEAVRPNVWMARKIDSGHKLEGGPSNE